MSSMMFVSSGSPTRRICRAAGCTCAASSLSGHCSQHEHGASKSASKYYGGGRARSSTSPPSHGVMSKDDAFDKQLQHELLKHHIVLPQLQLQLHGASPSPSHIKTAGGQPPTNHSHTTNYDATKCMVPSCTNQSSHGKGFCDYHSNPSQIFSRQPINIKRRHTSSHSPTRTLPHIQVQASSWNFSPQKTQLSLAHPHPHPTSPLPPSSPSPGPSSPPAPLSPLRFNHYPLSSLRSSTITYNSEHAGDHDSDAPPRNLRTAAGLVLSHECDRLKDTSVRAAASSSSSSSAAASGSSAAFPPANIQVPSAAPEPQHKPVQLAASASFTFDYEDPSKPMSAVQRQRAYRAALLSKALKHPPTIQPLPRQRIDELQAMMQKRSNATDLYKKHILVSDEQLYRTQQRRFQTQNNLSHFLVKRPSIAIVESIFKMKSIDDLKHVPEDKPLPVVEGADGASSSDHSDDSDSEHDENAVHIPDSPTLRSPSALLPVESLKLNSMKNSNLTSVTDQRKFSFSMMKQNISSVVKSSNNMGELANNARGLLNDMINTKMEVIKEREKEDTAVDIMFQQQDREHELLKTSDEASSSEASQRSLGYHVLAGASVEEFTGGHNVMSLRNREEQDPGALYLQGQNPYGQLGVSGSTTHLYYPTALQPLLRETIIQVACGWEHVLCRTQTHQGFAFGKNYKGQLGLGDTQSRDAPYSMHFKGSPLHQKQLVWLAASEKASAVITLDGNVYTFGDAETGSLGIGPVSALPAPLQTLPAPIAEFRHKHITKIVLGAQHGLAITNKGSVFAWGRHDYGATGQGIVSNTQVDWTPKPLGNFGDFFTDIAAGEHHSAALGHDGNLYMWGRNHTSQLGFVTAPAFACQSTPRVVNQMRNRGPIKVSCARHHTVVSTEDGEAYCSMIVVEQKFAEQIKFHKLKPRVPLKDIVATPTDQVIAILADGSILYWDWNGMDEPYLLNDTLLGCSLHELSVGIEHMAIIGTISKSQKAAAATIKEHVVNSRASL